MEESHSDIITRSEQCAYQISRISDRRFKEVLSKEMENFVAKTMKFC